MVTLDHVIDKSMEIVGRPVRHVDLVKVDVEGYEMRVLKGAIRTLERGLVERFVIEVHIDQVSTKDVIKYLGDYGYKLDAIIHFDHVKDMVYLGLRH